MKDSEPSCSPAKDKDSLQHHRAEDDSSKFKANILKAYTDQEQNTKEWARPKSVIIEQAPSLEKGTWTHLKSEWKKQFPVTDMNCLSCASLFMWLICSLSIVFVCAMDNYMPYLYYTATEFFNYFKAFF